MTDIESLVRQALVRHEAEVPSVDPIEVRAVATRTRRRQVRNLACAGLVGVVVLLGASSGLGAILRADDGRPAVPPTPVPPDGAAEPQDVTIVGVDYAYPDTPAEIAGGVIHLTFVNQGTVAHKATLTGIGETPIELFVQNLGGSTGLDRRSYLPYIDQVAVPSFVSVEAGATGEATFTLTPGRYVLWCSITDVAKGRDGAPHYQLGMVKEITVVGDDLDPELSDADGAITARDYAFDIDLDAGDRTVNFVNVGPDQIHMATIGVYPNGVSAAEAERGFEEIRAPGPPPKNLPRPTGLGFSGIYSEGLGSTFRLFDGEFESGRTYIFTCIVRDRDGGQTHLKAHDMYAIVTLE